MVIKLLKFEQKLEKHALSTPNLLANRGGGVHGTIVSSEKSLKLRIELNW